MAVISAGFISALCSLQLSNALLPLEYIQYAERSASLKTSILSSMRLVVLLRSLPDFFSVYPDRRIRVAF